MTRFVPDRSRWRRIDRRRVIAGRVLLIRVEVVNDWRAGGGDSPR